MLFWQPPAEKTKQKKTNTKKKQKKQKTKINNSKDWMID